MAFKETPDSLSGLPLSSAPIIVLDTETTGLDVAADRVIEIGAVRITGGDLDESDSFSAFVNPGIPIPPRVTEIHGITDEHVADAGSFEAIFSDFTEWAGPALVVGYSIGYDLAILKAEHARRDMPWHAPRCLDVRHLVQVFAPNLPKDSLEITADWLNIDVLNRHRALDDAQLTAQIFAILLLRLRERGVNTLAQAERLSRTRATQQEAEIKHGWHEVAGSGRSAPTSVSEYARIDSYPYRHKVAQIMHVPPLFAENHETLRQTLGRMTNQKVSSLFLSADSTGAHGIVTERDILRAIDTDGAAALDTPVSTYAVRPLVTVGSNEFVYRAISSMADKGFRHLGVTNDAGEIIGALSARDLLKQRASGAISLGDNIEAASSAAELGTVWSELITVTKGLVYEEVDPRNIAAVISRELRALTRRACELAERDMAAAGEGEPPVPYAMLVLGSGGRGESLLAMDQDNAIVYASGEPGGPEDQWFEKLGARIADTLNDAGVEYCKGGIMARNAAWRKDLKAWTETIESWVNKANPEDILNSDIFYDAKAVYGDWELADRLRGRAFAMARDGTNFLKFHTLNAANFQVPLGLFNRFKLDNGRIDIKKGGIMPIFSTARVLALEYGLDAHSTPERLEQAAQLKPHMQSSINSLIDAHKFLLDMILHQQLRDIDAGIALSNSIVPTDLTTHHRDELRWALEQVAQVSGLLDAPVV
jgi:CBS domain-containing protein